MFENVSGLASTRFVNYLRQVRERLHGMDYKTDWRILNARDFGVPQLRPRFILVAMKEESFVHFKWPDGNLEPPTVVKCSRT